MTLAGKSSKRLAPIVIAALSLALAVSAAAQESAAFLKITPGARPMAMGEAFTAVADDLNAMTLNPSGLGRMSASQAGFTHAELFAGAHYDFAAVAYPFGHDRSFLSGGAMGVGLQRLSQSAIEARDEGRRPTGSFTASDTALNLAYSRKIPGASAHVGANVKFIESRLADASARTFAVDVGVMRPYFFGSYPVTLGAAVRNLGPGLRFASETDPLPLTVALGGSVRVLGTVLLAADVRNRPNSRETSFSLGTEYAVLPTFALRSGYSRAAGAQSLPAGRGTAAFSGLGVGFGVKVYKAALDYSFSPYGELGTAQRISLATRF